MQLGGCLLVGDARTQPSDDFESEIIRDQRIRFAVSERRELAKRYPQGLCEAAVYTHEILRRNTDDSKRSTVDGDAPSYDRRIAVEARLPKVIADYEFRCRT